MPATCLITGATGFVGSHLAEVCVRRGMTVRTLARATSDTKWLEGLGVQIVRGDLTDPVAVKQAMQNVDLVLHSAAKVGDWGPTDDYRHVNVDGLRVLLDACKGLGLERFVHLSSLGVYAARHHFGTDETEPLPAQHMDGYTQSKVEAEKLALEYERTLGVPVVVLRPGFIYGQRDRTVFPKLVHALKSGQFRYLGGGERAMNTIFVGNLVHAVLLACESQAAVGQIYNLTDGEAVSKKKFIETICTGLQIPVPTKSVPLGVAKVLAGAFEGVAKLLRKQSAPRLTRARVKFLGLNLDFSIAKAQRELGYRPRTTFDEGMRETLAWYKQNLPSVIL